MPNQILEAKQIVKNERTAVAQKVTMQPDGLGLRVGKRAELTMIGNILPGGAELFRQRLPQFQAEANYWETRVATVQEFRGFLFDNDTRFVVTVVYDGDFKPYLNDIAVHAGLWLDALAPGVFEGYPGSISDPGAVKWVMDRMHVAEFFFAANEDVTANDVRRMKKLSKAVSDLLDAAS